MSNTAADLGFFDGGIPIEERRGDPRSALSQIVYMNMESENGGILLDISRSGLGFQVAAPFASGTQISFRVSSPGIDDFELSGELVWLDDTRKRGGLRFGRIPDEARSRIGEWIGAAKAPAANKRDAEIVSANSPRQKESAVAGVHSAALDDRTSRPARAQDRASQALPLEPAAQPAREALPNPLRSAWASSRLYSSPESEVNAHREWQIGATALTVFVLLIAAVGAFAFVNRRETGESLIRLGERLSGEQSQQSIAGTQSFVPGSSSPFAPEEAASANGAPQASAPNASVAAKSVGSEPAAESNLQSSKTQQKKRPDEASAPAKSNQAAPASGVESGKASKTPGGSNSDSELYASNVRQQSGLPTGLQKSDRPTAIGSSPADDGHLELSLAQKYLQGGGPNDRDMATHLLWIAVGEGNPEAEIQLADLYLRGGQGVSKNCEQARALLISASDSGNFAAGQQLSRLRDYGCR